MNERDDIIQYYSVALSKIGDKMDDVTKRLEKDNTTKENMAMELKNIDLDAEFFRLNNVSTTFNIAVKEAVANANSELTKLISSDGQPMKVNRAKKVIYKLPGEITMDSSTKTVVLSSIRNEAQRMRIKSLCDWMNEKQVIDTDSKKLIFKVENT
jgi:transcription initiation factor TFIIIB Brf1 subunit/transcription initiation factor TFIIB